MKLYIAPLGCPSYTNHVMTLKETTQYSSSSQSRYHQTAKSLTVNLFALSAQTSSKSTDLEMTVGGNPLDSYQDVRSPAVSTLDAKLHINSTISDSHKRARYCTADIEYIFYAPKCKYIST